MSDDAFGNVCSLCPLYVVDHVCGADEHTYDNFCWATCKGAYPWTKGRCMNNTIATFGNVAVNVTSLPPGANRRVDNDSNEFGGKTYDFWAVVGGSVADGVWWRRDDAHDGPDTDGGVGNVGGGGGNQRRANTVAVWHGRP